MKRAVIFLLLMSRTLTSFAGEGKVQLANVDKNPDRKTKKTVTSPLVTEKVEYYEVRGNSEKGLRCEMSKNGCRWSDGKKYDSVTTWRVRWDYNYDRAPEACTPDGFRATVEVTFRYPKWVSSDGAPESLAGKWDAYMKNLIVHEKGHRDMAVEAVTDLSRSVAELPPAATCAEIDRKVRELCQEKMAKLNADEQEYDRTTSHGLTQGAIFP